jgi:hypothetical protein
VPLIVVRVLHHHVHQTQRTKRGDVPDDLPQLPNGR